LIERGTLLSSSELEGQGVKKMKTEVRTGKKHKISIKIEELVK
jgi:hypothetical protein